MIKPLRALFKWRHFESEIIGCAVRWYLRFSLSCRDVEELVMERGLAAGHSTIWHWAQRYARETEQEMPAGIDTDQRILDAAMKTLRVGVQIWGPRR
jgi:transposase-like protein